MMHRSRFSSPVVETAKTKQGELNRNDEDASPSKGHRSKRFWSTRIFKRDASSLVPYCGLAILVVLTSKQLHVLCKQSALQDRVSRWNDHPRMIQLFEEEQETAYLAKRPLILSLGSRIELRHVTIERPRRDRSFYPDGPARPKSRIHPDASCNAIASWQERMNPNCLTFHEIDLQQFSSLHGDVQLKVVAHGAFRLVWMIRDYDGTKRALKTYKLDPKRHFDEKSMDRHRREAVVLERLTSSPYLVDIYGFCSESSLYKFADQGDLLQFFENDDGLEGKVVDSRQKLEMVYNMTMAVADMHLIDSRGRASVAHTDIKPNQFIMEDGYFKVSDFNRARLLAYRGDEVCGFKIQVNRGKWRSPEEYKYEPETEKVDIFSLGNVIYFVLTDGESPTKSPDDIIAGRLNELPEEILMSKDTNIRAMIKAMDMCFVYDPRERPPAREIAAFLKKALDDK